MKIIHLKARAKQKAINNSWVESLPRNECNDFSFFISTFLCLATFNPYFRIPSLENSTLDYEAGRDGKLQLGNENT
jgi:hypothetical protein